MNIPPLPAASRAGSTPVVVGHHLRARTKYFEFYRAEPKPLYADALRLRYQVYCLERGFLSPADYPEGREHDEFDEHAVHFLARHGTSLRPAGTARLVCHSSRGFPLLRHCRVNCGYAHLTDSRHAELRRFAEISRLAVSRHYRQRTTDTIVGGPPRRGRGPRVHSFVPDLYDCPATAGPEIVAGLYKCLYQEAKLREISHFLVAMERGLHLLLRRMDIHFTPIGPEADYYGPVRPYVLALRQLERDLRQARPEVLNYWLQGLPQRLWPPAGRGTPGATARDPVLPNPAAPDARLVAAKVA